MLRTTRHRLILVLFVLLPFHALFVTAGTKMIMGPGHAPLAALAIWKELIIAAIFIIGIVEIARSVVLPTCFQYVNILKTRKNRRSARLTFSLPCEVWLILGLLALAVFLSGFPARTIPFGFGFRYTILPLIVFLLFRQLSWDRAYIERTLIPVLAIVGAIVAAYGIVTFFLPQGFFTALGYSDAHSLYAPGSPLSAFQQVSGTGIRRIQATFAGPNQLGLWLLLPLSIALVRTESRSFVHSFIRFSLIVLISFALFLTFSRAAWIAAFVIGVIACGVQLRGRMRTAALAGIIGAAVVAIVLISTLSPQLLFRGISNRHHIERARQGIVSMIEKPLGHGLGTAGPASNRVSDPCVYFDEGADIGWAKDRPDLCLFVAGAQVRPSSLEKTCTCPVLPENWYIQIGYELGIAGFVLFVALVLIVLFRLFEYSNTRILEYSNTQNSRAMIVFLMFLGLSIAALFLHAWEDSAVAYTVWGMAGIALSGVSACFTNSQRAAAPAWQMPFAHRSPRT